jgi:uncharacterized protein YqfA (UPF0365 family)
MDYYQIQNVVADTQMRQSIADDGGDARPEPPE